MSLKKGKYKTVSGLTAIVAQLRSTKCTNWLLQGAIRVDDTNVYALHQWTSEGKSYTHPDCNLEKSDNEIQVA